jgi:RNA polymerase primary sigma factor
MALALGAGMLGSLEKPEEAQGMLAKMIMDAMEDFIQETLAGEKTDQKAAKKVNNVADKARELAEELHRKVTPEELSQETGLSLKAVMDALRISGYKIEDIEYEKSNG